MKWKTLKKEDLKSLLGKIAFIISPERTFFGLSFEGKTISRIIFKGLSIEADISYIYIYNYDKNETSYISFKELNKIQYLLIEEIENYE